MSSDKDNKKSTLKDGEDEKSEIIDKSTDSSKDADDIKNDNDDDVKEKAKIHTEIVDENDALKEDFEESKDEKDPLSNSEDENADSVEDAGSGDESEKNSVESEEEETKNSVKAGTGRLLGDIARIEASISRFKVDDLKVFHNFLFNDPGKTHLIKKNIKKFNGFGFEKGTTAYQKKLTALEKLEIKQLKNICEMLELDKKGAKDEIAVRICEFLVEPYDAETIKTSGGTGRPKRSAAVKAKNRGFSSPEEYSEEELMTSRRPQRARKGKRVNLKDESSSNESDDDKGSVYSANDDVSSEEEIPRVVAARGRRKGKVPPPKSTPKRTATKRPAEESEDEVDESEEEEEEDSDYSDEPKSKRGRGGANNKPAVNNKTKPTPKKNTPKVVPAANKNSVKSQKKAPEPTVNETPTPGRRGGARRTAAAIATTKVRGESSDDEHEKEKASSSEDEPLVKKSKTPQPPTDDEIKSYVKEILDGANLEEITMKTVCKQVYAHYPDFDLAHKKDFIKTTVKSLIST